MRQHVSIKALEMHRGLYVSSTGYSGANWKVYKYCFMKQNCQLQTGIAHYKNAATPLRTRGINTTH